VIFIPKYGYWASAWATLIVYAFQMVASYLLGQKYYPIKYNLRKFGMYLISSLLLFLISTWFDFENSVLKFFFNNFLILLFVALVYWVEFKLTATSKTENSVQ
jgi:O-antigen/teichoic acid export membrane protein